MEHVLLPKNRAVLESCKFCLAHVEEPAELPELRRPFQFDDSNLCRLAAQNLREPAGMWGHLFTWQVGSSDGLIPFATSRITTPLYISPCSVASPVLNWTCTKNGGENQLHYEMNQLELCLLAVRSWGCAGKFANWRTDFVGVLRFSADPSRVAQLLQESSNLQAPSRLRRVALEKDWWICSICMSYWRMKQT